MISRNSEAERRGGLKDGVGRIRFGSGSFEEPDNFFSRFEGGAATNPEELLAASSPPPPRNANRWAAGSISAPFTWSWTQPPGITGGQSPKPANQADENCRIFKALGAVSIELTAIVK
ncbi:MAG: hypothetical protein ACK58M_22290 [Acidobacteriota bacterium]